MKRLLLVTALAGWLAMPAPARAQNLVGDAVRQELEDRLRRVERDLEAVKETNESLRKRLASLDTVVGEVSRAAVERANSNNNLLKLAASKSELEQLAKALKESEQHREADKKWFVEQLKELGKLMGAATSAAPPSHSSSSPKAAKAKSESSGKSTPLPPGVPDSGVYHLVEKNQTALEILKAYNDDQKSKGRPGKITLKQLEAANHGLNMDKLRAGQKLFIPIPEK
ncbi:MAG: LysM domain-containing protein [Limisphaerales bacterium]